MLSCLRTIVAVAVALVVAAAGLALWQTWSAGASGLSALRQLCREDGRRMQLAQRLAALRERNSGKQRLTEEVVAGRLDLFAAAEAFRLLDEQTATDDPSDDDPGKLSDEALCLSVLSWVRAEAATNPQWRPVLRRLQADFAERFHHEPADEQALPSPEALSAGGPANGGAAE